MGKPYGIKPRCYWEHLEEHIREYFGNMLGTHWEQGQKKKKQKTPPGKTEPIMSGMLSLCVGCMKLLFPKLLVTIFDLG